MVEEISHEGVIKQLSEKKITVGIITESACASCHANGACTAADMKDKEVEITGFTGDFHIGQHIWIIGKASQGFKALFLGYLLPLILLIVVLIISLNLTDDEGTSGLLSLSILIPYYIILFLLRNNLKRSFEFVIKPL